MASVKERPRALEACSETLVKRDICSSPNPADKAIFVFCAASAKLNWPSVISRTLSKILLPLAPISKARACVPFTIVSACAARRKASNACCRAKTLAAAPAYAATKPPRPCAWAENCLLAETPALV